MLDDLNRDRCIAQQATRIAERRARWRLCVSALLSVGLLAGCAGVSTLPVYESRSSQWSSTGGGNPFVLRQKGTTLRLAVLGLWPHWWWVGPLPLPLIPSPYPGREITVTLSSQPPAIAEGVRDLHLLADGAALEPLDRNVAAGAVRFRFRSPQAKPDTVTVRIGGWPDAVLHVGSERCYWLGDSYPSYRACSEAAKSADAQF